MRLNNTPVKRDENIDISKLFAQFIKYWKYYLIIGSICLFAAIAFIIITPPEYEVKSSIKLTSAKDGMSSELKMLKSSGLSSLLGGSAAGGINADDEVLTIQSKAILGNVIHDLGLQIDILQKEGFKTVSKYKKSPVKIEFPTNFLDTLSNPISIKISESSDKVKLEIKSPLTGKLKFSDISFPYIVKTSAGNIKIDKTGYYVSNKDIEIRIYPLTSLYETYQKRVKIGVADPGSDIINLDIIDENKNRGIDILNAIMKAYNDYAKSVKITESGVNASFVKDKLAIVTLELDSIENKIELYKKQNNIPDLSAYGKVIYAGAEESGNKILEMQTQLKLMEYVLGYLKNPNNKYAIVPNVNYEGEAITKAYNNLMFERIRLLKSTEPSNPALLLVNDQLKEQRSALVETINSAIKTLKITISEIDKKNTSLNSQLSELPAKEKEYIELKRLQKVKESLYLFLLQKLEEKEIANSPDEMASHTIDQAYASLKPVFPKKIIVLSIAFISSIILFIIVISIRIFVIKKTASKHDFSDNIILPIWGTFSDYNSFNILRNLIYSKNDQSSVFVVTSNIPNEGKTYFASNITKSLSVTDRKIVHLKMNFSQSEALEYERSLNAYIEGKADISNILIKEADNLYTITVLNGDKDPGVLIYSNKMQELIKYLKTKFNYVFIDTDSLSMSSSVYDIAHLADYTFFIIREDYTPKNKLENINRITSSCLLPNVSIVLNKK